jgi:hypothetical protein
MKIEIDEELFKRVVGKLQKYNAVQRDMMQGESAQEEIKALQKAKRDALEGDK